MVTLKANLRHLLSCLLALVIFSSVASAQKRGFAIQVASVTSEAEAKSMVATLKADGIEAYWVKAEVPGLGTRYRIRIGRFTDQPNAKALAQRTLSRGLIKEYIITLYDPPTSGASPLRGAPDNLTATAKPSKLDQPDVEKSQTGKEKSLSKDSIQAPVAGATAPKTTGTSQRSSITAPVNPPIIKSGTVKMAPSKKPIQPDLAVNSNPSPSTTNIDPNIANPAGADPMADFSIKNDNWKVVRRSTESDKNLRAIHFVDSMMGWAAGDGGMVYRTADGGRTWKSLLIGAAANINFIYFVDWNNGWMLGEQTGKEPANSEGGGEIILFSTTDGGRTWTRKPLPNVLSLHFIDAKNGWAVGKDATVIKTTNGGENWTKVLGMEKLIGLPVESSNYNFGFRDVFFLDPLHGWIVGNFYGRARTNIGGLFVTADGGLSWKRIPLTLQTQYSSGRFTPGVLHTVRYTDLNTGTVTGEMYDGLGRFFFVLHTRDGGKTWEQFRTPSRASHNTQFLNVSNGWSAAAAPREGNTEAVIYDTTLMRTDNGGMSWQNDFVARGRRILGVFFISPTKGWAVGDHGMILSYEEKTKMD